MCRTMKSPSRRPPPPCPTLPRTPSGGTPTARPLLLHQRRSNCPARNGSSSWQTIETSECAEKPPPCSTSPARSGVTTIPTMLENDPAQIAAATLPRAMEVNAIDDWTVDGTRHRNSRPE
ncbi:hypothetical protein GCM10010211_45200 [Streptomyces albospinus]|uniref:Transposase n=1 Tax=Streptomyces albospinus TaxID=285515 RepID=A0ABQ2VCE6_9ACTN|nr:hypothetical protein GCM10010211_45200 [Streptomyces albospinus]